MIDLGCRQSNREKNCLSYVQLPKNMAADSAFLTYWVNDVDYNLRRNHRKWIWCSRLNCTERSFTEDYLTYLSYQKGTYEIVCLDKLFLTWRADKAKRHVVEQNTELSIHRTEIWILIFVLTNALCLLPTLFIKSMGCLDLIFSLMKYCIY